MPPGRIAEVAAMLDDKPAGLGKNYHDRAAWDALGRMPVHRAIIARAEKLSRQTFPPWSDDAYSDYARTGSRAVTAKLFSSREKWLAPLVWAECLENRGRFTARINAVLEEFAHQKTWTTPFNNPDNGNADTVHFSVGLESALFARELAQALYLLDDKVTPTVRADVMAALQERVFNPVLTSYRTRRGHWWITARSNWNSVCLAGVTGAALTVLPSKEDRAAFAVAGAFYSANGIAGYKDDGYDPEGPGYYNYGFGSYLGLRESLYEATHGKLDLFSDPKIRNIALFGPRITIINGQVPPFEDCKVGTTINPAIIAYCSRALGLGLKEEPPRVPAKLESLFSACFHAFPSDAAETEAANAAPPEAGVGLRSYFDQAQVLVCRPAPGGRLGVALKGGNNEKPHNHNDVGSFVVVVGKEQLAGDPGGPATYNSRTFSAGRYTEFKTCASYGHPVPLVAGVQQKAGAASAATVTRQEFSDGRDVLAMEMASAYPVTGLQTLRRTFEFSRAGAGSFAVRDEFEMADPGAFETALTSHAKWTRTAPDTISFTRHGETLRAKITASADWELTRDTVNEEGLMFHRLAVRLKAPAARGWIHIIYSP